MAEIQDISNWGSLPWFNTGGTRAKKYLFNPEDNKTYYFKKSADKYPYEFWSEVMAYELGKILKLDVLEYLPAIHEGEIGCVCQSMIDPDKEELIEGGKYLQAFDTTFSPEDKKLRHQYTFQLIEGSLQFFGLDNYMDKILEIVVFDALIGNSDRHQENWAFIGNYSSLAQSLTEIEYAVNSPEFQKLPKWMQGLLNFVFEKKADKKALRKEASVIKLGLRKNIRFAPIYDNGSSLCRECTPEKIDSMLKNQTELEAYIRKGLAEIHWDGEKIGHFDFIGKVIVTSHAEQLRNIIQKVVKNYNEGAFKKVLDEIDNAVPQSYSAVKIPQNRKEIICKLVTLRAQKLGALL